MTRTGPREETIALAVDVVSTAARSQRLFILNLTMTKKYRDGPIASRFAKGVQVSRYMSEIGFSEVTLLALQGIPSMAGIAG